jgi:hypothetical protein
MAFANKKRNKITKVKIKKEDFEKIENRFEPIGNNDYWVFKSMQLQRTHLNNNPGDVNGSPKGILYQSQDTQSLTNLFGKCPLPQYMDYIYDIWVVNYKNRRFLIRQSPDGTVYDIELEDKEFIRGDQSIGNEIEDFMMELLKEYTK